ncbi:MAG: hypothetical protein C5B48_08340 [Candidatus Rokuibacteriota bacterium]|nr:MAG: hypothetical protein C5B48_08340 [Candidatus Rokubacteria bacterium]
MLVARLALAALALAAPIPHFAQMDTGPAGGTVWLGVIPGTATGRISAVYLPPGFTTTRRYPVVYLLHGMPGSPNSYTDSLQLVTVADELISSGATRPFIAVVPVAGPSSRYDGEWTGPWEDYLVRDVVPWADARLPTIEGPEGRVLAGLSAGGYGAVDVGLRHPRLFGTLESWSGYFHPLRDGTLKHASRAVLWAHDPTRLVRTIAPLLRRDHDRFFLGAGPSHGVVRERNTVDFARELRSLDVQYDLWPVPAALEKTPYEAQLVQGLRYAFPPG